MGMTTYISTRGDFAPKSFTDVLVSGMAPDGGLYVPENWPKLDMDSLAGKSYTEIAFDVMKPFVGGDIPDADLKTMIDGVYGKNFSHADVAPLVKLKDNLWVMELFHGPTLAFKDYALQMLGALFDYVLTRQNRHVTIVGATSGDTGSAAIEGCRASKNIDIFILHPYGRTSEVQRRQMTTIHAPHVHNIALKGTFDDAQNIVKSMFADEDFRRDMSLSAVNSINWARIMAQIVYYVAACVRLGAGDANKVSFAVPTGNFGNVYAAYCAKKMGAPIDRLIIGSNRNDILTRFFETGTMKTKEVEPSLSPSMDIQISSNFERYLFDLCGRDAARVRGYMASFRQTGAFTMPDDDMAMARMLFSAARCKDEETAHTITSVKNDFEYTMDPHTAVGFHAAQVADISGAVVVMACAHPAKFPDAVQKATGVYPGLPPHLADLYERPEYMDIVPNDLGTLKNFVKERVSKK